MLSKIKKIIKSVVPLFILEMLIEFKRYINYNKTTAKKITVYKKNLSLITLGDETRHTFFGYYDITPFNVLTNEIVYLEVPKSNLDKANIILYDLDNKTKYKITTTNIWNWQQGSRLRWFPLCSDKIIFNDYKNGKYISRIIDIRLKKETSLDYPIYDIDSNGKYAISLNFKRLGVKRPGYGYSFDDINSPKNIKNDGIYIIDIAKNKIKSILTYEDIALALSLKIIDFKNNYINHLSFSPSGNKFLFFWITIIKGFHQASLIVFDLELKKIIPLETNGKASHYVWIDDESLICTIYDDKNHCRYIKYYLDGKKKLINDRSLQKDGHPSILDQKSLITDTYPDKFGFQKILFSNLVLDKTNAIAKIYSKFKINPEHRTDLHPRLNNSKNKICFDANINGYRQLYILSAYPNETGFEIQ